MWSGRFREPLDPFFDQWQRSLKFDWGLLSHELDASHAHALALEGAGILTTDECAQIISGLEHIHEEYVGHPELIRNHGAGAEDVHHFVELRLVKAIGDLGLKLHTGRSRNEQIATDLRLYVRYYAKLILRSLSSWAQALVEKAQSAGEAVIPSYTHLQRAEPVLVAHWLLAYVE